MTNKAKKQFILNTLFIFCVILAGYFVLRYLLVYTLPFLLGLAMVTLLRPISRFFKTNGKVSERCSTIFSLTLFYLMLALALLYLGNLLFSWISTLPAFYEQTIWPVILKLSERYSVLQSLSEHFAPVAMDIAASFVSAVPGFAIAFIFTVLSSFFIASDFERIKNLLYKIPYASRIHAFFTDTLAGILRCYITLAIITFAELSIALFFLGVEHFIKIAAIISLVDFLPVLGSSAVLLPWAVFEIASGNLYFGISLVVLTLIIGFIRNILEQKFVSKNIGLNPLLSVFCSYTGFKLFGAWGLIFGPVVGLFVKSVLAFEPPEPTQPTQSHSAPQ